MNIQIKTENLDEEDKKPVFIYKGPLFPCNFCQMNFISEEFLQKHNRRCLNRNLHCLIKRKLEEFFVFYKLNKKNRIQCDNCHASFKNETSLRNHKRMHQNNKSNSYNKNVYHCKYCFNSFTLENNLKRHLMKIHNKTKEYCFVCWQEFNQRNFLFGHLKSEHGIYACQHCPLTFFEDKHLIDHVAEKHKKERKQCKECDKSYHRNDELKRHMILEHSKEEPFKCTICNKRFKLQFYLTRHLRTHDSNPNYECEICSKTFHIKYNLSKHLRSHSGDKPFECEVCKKTFGHRFVLKRHKLTHLKKEK